MSLGLLLAWFGLFAAVGFLSVCIALGAHRLLLALEARRARRLNGPTGSQLRDRAGR